MTPRLLTDAHGAAVYHADWRALLGVVPRCNTLIVDAPYSERTHNGHGTMERWGTATPPSYDGGERREINYQCWTDVDVRDFVEAWSPRVSGWMVSITDDVLAPVWRRELERVGRYAFAPLPFVAPGSRVRLAGDGPSCWTTWLVSAASKEIAGPCELGAHVVVARPRTKEALKWGTLPGAYVLPKGYSEKMPVVGGKPLWLMERLVEDYSRPGDLVVDPCCGAGTTLLGAIRTGRRAVGGDALQEHADLAARRVSGMQQIGLFA